jgi:hypothetical protein
LRELHFFHAIAGAADDLQGFLESGTGGGLGPLFEIDGRIADGDVLGFAADCGRVAEASSGGTGIGCPNLILSVYI